LNYKTLRYFGHHAGVRQLLDNGNNWDNIQRYFNTLEKTTEDVVFVLIQAQNLVTNRQKIYAKRFFSYNGQTAIQRLTSAGCRAIVQLMPFIQKTQPVGLVPMESIPINEFLRTHAGSQFSDIMDVK